MKEKTKKIRLQGRCNQKWEDMKPSNEGRQCERCNKCVIDFRNKTLEDISKIHQKSSNTLCGIYHPKQLTTSDNKFSTYPLWSSLKKVAFIGIFSTLFGQHASATERYMNTTNSKSTLHSSINLGVSTNILDSIPLIHSTVIHGVVSAYEGEYLIGANVVVKGTTCGTVTDFDGKYELDVSPVAAKSGDRLTIEFSYAGFDKREITLVVGDPHEQHITIEKGDPLNAKLSSRELKEICVVGYYISADRIKRKKKSNFFRKLFPKKNKTAK